MASLPILQPGVPREPRSKRWSMWKRWSIEDSFETAKNEFRLDHNETRSWHGWHRHVSLVMLAFAVLAVTRHRANATAEETPVAVSRSDRRSSAGRSRKSAASPHASRSAASSLHSSSPGQLGERAHQADAQRAHLKRKPQL